MERSSTESKTGDDNYDVVKVEPSKTDEDVTTRAKAKVQSQRLTKDSDVEGSSSDTDRDSDDELVEKVCGLWTQI